jgi:hypothetical protein
MSVVGAALRGFGKALKRKGKVSPTIKSVKPNLKKTVSESKADEYRRRYTGLDKADDKVKKGREMMREGQRERRRMVDTGKAFQFRHGKSYHAIDPREPKRYVDSMKKPKPAKRFYTAKELEQQDYFNKGKGRERKAAGGLMKAVRKLKQMQDRKKRMGRPGPSTRSEPKRKIKPSPRKERPKKYPPQRIMTPLAKGGRSFPDLSGDGKVTKKDILMGRGVIKK